MRTIVLGVALMLAGLFAPATGVCGETKVTDPVQLFYNGNASYDAKDYMNALLDYDAILTSGLESGNVYYNVGNSFFKLRKPGYAILFYERARRLMPSDSDVRANLSFARALTGEASYDETVDRAVIRTIKRSIRDFDLSSLALWTLGAYLLAAAMIAASLVYPIPLKKFRTGVAVLIAVAAYATVAFAVKYYSEVVLTHGVILAKDVEARYQPIDKSSTFFKPREGSEVLILKTANGWRQIRRADGKTGWVKREDVEPI